MSSRRPSEPSCRSDQSTRLLLSPCRLGHGDLKAIGLSAIIGVLLYGLVLTGCLIQTTFLQPRRGAATAPNNVGPPSTVISLTRDQDCQDEALLPRIRSLAKLKEQEEYEWLELDGRRSDLILIEHERDWTTLRRSCGATGREIWTKRFPSIIGTEIADSAPTSIRKRDPPIRTGARRNLRPRLIRPAPDLDGDGTGDLVWYSHEYLNACILAISGDSGKLLWLVAEPAGDGSRISSRPFVADANHDGLADIIVCIARQKGPPRVEAISGKEGTRLWRQCLGDTSARSANSNGTRPPRDTPRLVDLVRCHGQTLVAVEVESQIHFHSVESGLPIADPLSPPGTGSQATFFADFNEDGQSEAILFRRHDTRELVAGFPPFTISAWQIDVGRQLWRRQRSCALAADGLAADGQGNRMLPLTDVDDDRHAELAITNYVRSSLSVDLVDAMTCESRWPQHHRLSRNPDASVGQVLQCPDLDGDAVDELLVVTIDQLRRTQSRVAVFLDLLSGRNGESLATLCRPLSGLGGRKFEMARWLPQRNSFPLLAIVTSQTSHRDLDRLENGKSIDIWSLWNRELVCSIDEVDRFQFCDFEGEGTVSICISRQGIGGPAINVVDFDSTEAEPTASSTEGHDETTLGLSYLNEAECRVLDAHTDPRWLEPLPWSTMLDRTINEIVGNDTHPAVARVEYLALALFACLGIFVAPAWFAFRLIADRRWSLGRWLLLPAVVGVAIACISILAGHRQTQSIAFFSGLPVLIVTLLVPLMSWTILLLPIELATLMLRRHYNTVVVLFSVATLVSIIAAAAWLLPVWSRMDQDSRFDWAQWHWIWLAAAYVTGWGYLLANSVFQVTNRLFSS